MNPRISKLLVNTFFASSAVSVAIYANRQYHLRGDKIQNTDKDLFLEFAENQRAQGKRMFSPWLTRDKDLLHLANRHGIPLPDLDKLTQPYFPPVKIEPLSRSAALELDKDKSTPMYVCVGGPPAAMVAIQRAVDREPILYVNYSRSDKRAISEGSAYHGEFDAESEKPAYFAGKTVPAFFYDQTLRLIHPPRYDSDVIKPDFSWLSLNWVEWIYHPQQWLPGFRVVWGNYQKTKIYENEHALGKLSPEIIEMRERTRHCEMWLTALDKYLGGNLFLNREFGSLTIAPTEQDWQDLQKFQKALKEEGRSLVEVNSEQMLNKYGFIPRHVAGSLEKIHDRVFRHDFMLRIANAIKNQGGEVHLDWQLRKILIDPEQPGGIVEFVEKTEQGEIVHRRRFIQAHLSLGISDYDPSQADLASVTGVSINAILYGVALRTSILCGGSNNMVPLTEPMVLNTTDQDGKSSENNNITFVRLTAAGCVNPRFRGDNSYTYDGQHAVHLLHRVRETLPANARLVPLSVIGCNRMFIENGMSLWKNPEIKINGRKHLIPSIKIQLGAGGGGISQSAAEAHKIAKNQEHPFPQESKNEQSLRR